jgi:hypothetical protein
MKVNRLYALMKTANKFLIELYALIALTKFISMMDGIKWGQRLNAIIVNILLEKFCAPLVEK